MKISCKFWNVELTKAISMPISTSKFMNNTQIKSIIALNHHDIALVRTSSILVFNCQESTIKNTIMLDSQIDQVSYLPQSNLFCAYQIAEKQVICFTNEPSPTIRCLYNFNENKVNIQFEWSPWILVFRQSQSIALVRKLYGQSLIVVLKAFPQFCKTWQFTCNQSSISKMDENQYLVNFDEDNNKFSLKIFVYNCDSKQKSRYKIENIQPNICKGVKLLGKTIDRKQNGHEYVWLKVAIGVNYKINGGGIIICNLLEGSDNQYEPISTIPINNCEINHMLNASISNRSLQVLVFKYVPEHHQIGHFFTNYKLNDYEDHVLITDNKEIESGIDDVVYNTSTMELIAFSNIYTRQNNTSFENLDHNLKLFRYRLMDKKVCYIHLLENYLNGQSRNCFQEVLDLL